MTTKLIKVGTGRTTPVHDTKPQVIKVDMRPIRKAENEAYLKEPNVRALLGVIAWAEGGNYYARYGYGWAKGDWSFSDESTHPGAGYGGSTSAAGMYQINLDTWRDHGIKRQGLTDFSPHTQDLIAISRLRSVEAIDAILVGNFEGAIWGASIPWSALEKGPGLGSRYPQPYKKYEVLLKKYKELGGTCK